MCRVYERKRNNAQGKRVISDGNIPGIVGLTTVVVGATVSVDVNGPRVDVAVVTGPPS